MQRVVLTVFLGLLGFNGHSQDPNLYQKWYLYSYEYDLGDRYFIHDVVPPIGPYLTIEPSLDFSGTVCNEYDGTFTYNSIEDTLILDSFNICVCGSCISPPQSHINLEEDYFDYFYIGLDYYYDIFEVNPPVGDPYMYLIIFNAPGFELHYKNIEVLSIEDKFQEVFTIYPNPATDEVFISGQLAEKAFSLYSVLGVEVRKGEVSSNNTIEVRELNAGMYILKLADGRSGKIIVE